MLHRIGTALVVLLALACGAPEAWAQKVGPEFRVNTTAAGHQVETRPLPGLATAALSSPGIPWMALSILVSTASVTPLRARPPAAEFRVNTYLAAHHQPDPSVAGLSDGGFVVTWGFVVTRIGSLGMAVYGQRYTAAGAPRGGEFRVNSYTANDQPDPSVAGLSDGGFVVTWTFRDSARTAISHGVYGQRYSSTGARAGGEFRVNIYTGPHQDRPSVAGLSGGGFVVTWTSVGQDGSSSVSTASVTTPPARPPAASSGSIP